MPFPKPVEHLRSRWHAEGGYRRLLVIAIPLILSTGSWSIQHFVDRVFLTWHSPEAIAAAMPAGMVNFAIMSLFLGTTTYASTFVAQYYGAGRQERIGPAIWQGLYIALIGAAAIFCLIPLAGPLFRLVGHEQHLQEYERIYFQTLCLGAGPALASAAMAGFFSGRGKTWPVMWVNVFATSVNLVLDYGLIFGRFGLPELGIRGAALATVFSGCASFAAYLVLLSRKPYNERYHTMKGWRFDRTLFVRLLRFGLPSGIQFSLNVAAISAFVLFVGRLGTTALAATNITFNIGSMAFMPMIGTGMAVSVLVGQHLGNDRPDLAARATYSGLHLALVYMGGLAVAFALVPHLFLAPFAARAQGPAFTPVRDLSAVLLRFVACYCFFRAVGLIFASALKGAGDTRFVMFMIIVISSTVLVIPSYVGLVLLGGSIYVGWTIFTAFIVALGSAFLLRFLSGKWKSMRVIEEAPSPPAMAAEVPPAELNP